MPLPSLHGWRVLKDEHDLALWREITSAETYSDPPSYPCLARIYTSEDLWHSEEYQTADTLRELLALLGQ